MQTICYDLSLLALCCTLIFATGCATTPKKEVDTPLTPDEIRAFLKRGKDSNVFWIRSYASQDGYCFENADRIKGRGLARISYVFSRRENRPIIRVTPHFGKPLTALLDTTSRNSWVDIAKTFDCDLAPIIPPGHRRTPLHLTNQVPGYLSVASELIFDSIRMDAVILCPRMANGLGPLSRGAENIDLILGNNILHAFNMVRIDGQDRSLVFSTVPQYSPQEDHLITTLPTEWSSGALTVDGVINGKPHKILLDTAGDFELAMDPCVFDMVRQVSIGDLVFRQVKAVSSEELGLSLDMPRIGSRLLSRFVLVLDNTKDVLHVEKPRTVKL